MGIPKKITKNPLTENSGDKPDLEKGPLPQKPKRRKKVEQNNLSKPVLQPPKRTSNGNNEKYKTDPKTGIQYEELPETKLDREGRPISQIDNFNLDNLSGEADRFMKHLRQAPSKEEQRALRNERKKIELQKQKAYQEQQEALNDKLGKQIDPVDESYYSEEE